MRRTVLLIASFFILVPCAFADYKELFQREFVDKPWAGTPLVEEGVCIECHTSDIMDSEYLRIPQEWKMSIHYRNIVSCHDCHGGDPDDVAISCGTPHSGFVGTPEYSKIPEMCGKCHIGILDNYRKSGHGRALKVTGQGPNCVTCHSAHNTQKASIDIINEVTCKKCHSYERAKIMKQALFITEKKISDINKNFELLKPEGLVTVEQEKALFRTQAQFRTLFHMIDASLVKARTDEFLKKLNEIEARIQEFYDELAFRKNFSAFLFLLFIGMGIVIFSLSRTHKD